MNKKASVFDAAPILWIVFGIAFVATIVGIIISYVNTDFQADPTITQEAKNIIQTGATEFPNVMDFWFVLFLVGLPIISAVFAYFDNIHPLFFWASLFLVVVVVMVGAGISEFWTALMEDATFSAQASLMPMSNYILSNFGMYSLFVFIIIASGTFFKLRGRDQYGGF